MEPQTKSVMQEVDPGSPVASGIADRLLATEKLVKEYLHRRVVNGVDITVAPGEIVGLLGPNGAGKTTTFNIVVGLTRADAGEVTLDSVSLTKLPMHERARKGLGYLPQDSSIFKKLTVRKNMLAVLELDEKLSAAQRHQRAQQTLDEFG